MTSETKLKVAGRAKLKKRFSWLALIAIAFLTGLAGAVATLIVERGFDGLVGIVDQRDTEKKPPYRLTLASPISDGGMQRRFQFLLIENVGNTPIKDFECKITCARTVDISGEKLVDFNRSSSLRRTADAIYIEAKSIPAKGSLLLLVWHKLGGIEPSDIAITWEGQIVEPEVNYLR